MMEADRNSRTARAVGIFLAAAAAMVAGCGKDAGSDAPPASQPTTQASQPDLPDLPGEVANELAEGASPILIKPLAPGERPTTITYVQDDKLPAGDILGLCYIPTKKPLDVSAPPPVDIKGPRDAIVDPEPEELGYYGKIQLRRPRWISAFSSKQGGHPVVGAVVMIRGVKKGPATPLGRGTFQVNNGELIPRIAFTPVNDRVEFRTFDAFSNHFVMTNRADGKTFFDRVLLGNNATFRGHGAMDKQHLIAWSLTQWRKLAKPIRTDPIRERGFFDVRCLRHPWQKGYVVAFDNPYIAASDDHDRRQGIFRITKIPAGTWDLEVWHPVLEPVKRVLKVKIVADECLEVPIAFRPPGAH